MTQPKFDTSRREFEVICAIADRAIGFARTQGTPLDKMTTVMDLAAAHNSRPLRLDALLDATPADFTHDVFGIIGNIDRETGELGGLFEPRLARPVAAPAE